MTSPRLQTSIRPLYIVLLLIGVATIGFWATLIFKIPIFETLPYWTFLQHETPVNFYWAALAGITLTIATLIRFSRFSPIYKAALIALAGIVVQSSFTFSKGHGLLAFEERIMDSGHAEFFSAAQEQTTLKKMLLEYETIAQDDRYEYLPSKPPGTLLFYIFTLKTISFIAQYFPSELPETVLAGIGWTCLSYAVIFPIFFLTREYFNGEAALNACLLFISVPSVFFGNQKRRLLVAFVSGVAYYMAVFFSFGLIVIGAFYLVPLIEKSGREYPKHLRASLSLLLAAILGFFAADLLARLLIGYDIYVRYTSAMLHRLGWKGWENSLEVFFGANTTNLIEFFTWIGLPISVL